MNEQTGYDATRDPRTGRPVLPIDADSSQADAHSEPLGYEDNEGIAMGDDEGMTALAHEDNQAIHKVLVCRNADNAFAGHFRW